MASTEPTGTVAANPAATIAMFDLGPQWEHVKALGSGSFGSVQLFRHVASQVRAHSMRCNAHPAPAYARRRPPRIRLHLEKPGHRRWRSGLYLRHAGGPSPCGLTRIVHPACTSVRHACCWAHIQTAFLTSVEAYPPLVACSHLPDTSYAPSHLPANTCWAVLGGSW